MSLSRRRQTLERKDTFKADDASEGETETRQRRGKQAPSSAIVLFLIVIFIVLVFVKRTTLKDRSRLRTPMRIGIPIGRPPIDSIKQPFLTTTNVDTARRADTLAHVEELFACGIPKSKLNDDFCDCPLDGSDELTTGACSPVGSLVCGNRRIPSSKIKDGIADCCDGSDEGFPESFKLPPGC